MVRALISLTTRKIGNNRLGPSLSIAELRAQVAPAVRSAPLSLFCAVCAVIALAASLGSSSASAVEAVKVGVDTAVIDLANAVELQHTDAEHIQVSTAPGADGIVRHIEVGRREAGSSWAVFALANNSDDQIDRLIVAPHHRMDGCALLGADQGKMGIVNITSSSGEQPGRLKATTDVFRVTLDPGTVVTFVAELRGLTLPQLYLWEPEALIACAVDTIR